METHQPREHVRFIYSYVPTNSINTKASKGNLGGFTEFVSILCEIKRRYMKQDHFLFAIAVIKVHSGETTRVSQSSDGAATQKLRKGE